ncbi:glutamine synthetase/guanido kinase [Phlyctochytrium arcticum]|nr:glutamine synthetase/guanido kinase [Phlyctochytrium arcticum]
MLEAPKSENDLVEILKNTTRVKVSGSDIDGIARGKIMDKNKFLSSLKDGFGFCNVAFNWDMHDKVYDHDLFPQTTPREISFADILARPDYKTLRCIPWEKDMPHVLVDFLKVDGTPYPVCPRGLLKRMIKRCGDAGYSAYCGMEFEFFNFQESSESFHGKRGDDLTPLTKGMFGYSLHRPAANADYFAAIYDLCYQYRIPIEGLHTETGPGVYEAALCYAPALEMADRAHLFKSAVKQIAIPYKIIPSFMAKPSHDLPGCSGHIHISLKGLDGKPLFDVQEATEKGGEPTINAPLQHFVAGILTALPTMLPFFAPTINSYKRLVENYWAPTQNTYGVQDRIAAIRIIAPSRIEFRVPGADVNPYIAIAGLLGAGMWGIENKLDLSKVKTETLPKDLKIATDRMVAKDSIARQVIGDEFIDHFGGTRLNEWKQWCQTVTSWERLRYMETV